MAQIRWQCHIATMSVPLQVASATFSGRQLWQTEQRPGASGVYCVETSVHSSGLKCATVGSQACFLWRSLAWPNGQIAKNSHVLSDLGGRAYCIRFIKLGLQV